MKKVSVFIKINSTEFSFENLLSEKIWIHEIFVFIHMFAFIIINLNEQIFVSFFIAFHIHFHLATRQRGNEFLKHCYRARFQLNFITYFVSFFASWLLGISIQYVTWILYVKHSIFM